MERIPDKDRAFAGESPEVRLRALLMHGLAGDSSDYHAFLKALSAHLLIGPRLLRW